MYRTGANGSAQRATPKWRPARQLLGSGGPLVCVWWWWGGATMGGQGPGGWAPARPSLLAQPGRRVHVCLHLITAGCGGPGGPQPAAGRANKLLHSNEHHWSAAEWPLPAGGRTPQIWCQFAGAGCPVGRAAKVRDTFNSIVTSTWRRRVARARPVSVAQIDGHSPIRAVAGGAQAKVIVIGPRRRLF